MGNSPDPPEDASGEDIVAPLERLARLMRAGEHDEELNPAQWEALRYLFRANRFSNSPGALARYLGATKGTVSQSVMVLERKGFVGKSKRAGESRSIALALTPKGQATLTRDPWAKLAASTGELGNKTRRRLAKGLRELLAAEQRRGRYASFGTCANCRFFRELGASGASGGPHQCMLFSEPLSAAETRKICVEHEPSG